MKKVIAILSLLILFVVFIILRFNDIVLFDQCERTGCSGEICSARPVMSACMAQLEHGCLKDCKVRNFRCGFDSVYESECTVCVQNCKEQFSPMITDRTEYLKLMECANVCFSKPAQ